MNTFVPPVILPKQSFLSFMAQNVQSLAVNFALFNRETHGAMLAAEDEPGQAVINFSGLEFLKHQFDKIPAAVRGDVELKQFLSGCVEMMNRLHDMGCPPFFAPVEALNGYLRGLALKNAVIGGMNQEQAIAELAKSEGFEAKDVGVHIVGAPKDAGIPPVIGAEDMPPLRKAAPAKSPHDEKLGDILSRMVEKHAGEGK
jgi:hypothetical protein